MNTVIYIAQEMLDTEKKAGKLSILQEMLDTGRKAVTQLYIYIIINNLSIIPGNFGFAITKY